jgi:FlaG/FlaF family flagellin (archaellin)
MELKQLLTDDSAVSTVIAVILMVAITVILAASIGTFVLGLADSVNDTAPQATFSFEYEQNESGSDVLIITHEGGDTIEGQNLNITSDGATDKDPPGYIHDAYVGTDVFTGEITAGTEATVNNTTFKSFQGNVRFLSGRSGGSSKLDLSGATIRVVYSDETGDSSATLAKWEGPDA